MTGEPGAEPAVPWSVAIEQALYGSRGFYRRGAGPAGHFRTSVHASPLLAELVHTLLDDLDVALDRPQRLDLVDVGAGRGELLSAVLAGAGHAPWADRLRPVAVERAPRPAGLASAVTWTDTVPAGVRGLLLAHEWLDDVPVDAVEVGPDGPRLVLVDRPDGRESAGPPPDEAAIAWLDQWWPLHRARPGDRAELGEARDVAWATVVARVEAGLAIAVDYGHVRTQRADGAYASGTLLGFRDGRAVRPVPDGSCDITAHVALDACAAAGSAVARDGECRLLTQRDVVGAVLTAAPLPAAVSAGEDPTTYARALQRRADLAELRDPGGLGAHLWLAQSVRMPLPAVLASCPSTLAPPRG